MAGVLVNASSKNNPQLALLTGVLACTLKVAIGISTPALPRGIPFASIVMTTWFAPLAAQLTTPGLLLTQPFVP